MKFQTPKGTRDFLPGDMSGRRKVVDSLVSVYELFGFGEWDGPAFEYLETLICKSGENVIQEIYSFKDKSGRDLGLRFELTASIARIVANYSNFKKPFKVYGIGKVWRYERPQAGRFREFLQADTDIFGSPDMACEAELLVMAVMAIEKLGLKDYVILLNNRKILEAQLRTVGIGEDRKVSALRALDKLSKIGEAGVISEFEKASIQAEKFSSLKKFINIDGDNEKRLQTTEKLLSMDAKGKEGVNELREIVKLVESYGFVNVIEIDSSLVRGLDYYTGPIFEIRSKNKKDIGSFAGGGRYDELVELFGGRPTPAVGISFGIERLIEIISEDICKTKSSLPVKVFVACASKEIMPIVLSTVQKFRKAGIASEYDLMGRSLGKQLSYVNANNIPYAFIVFSKDEQKLKDMASGQENICSIEEAISRLS